MKAEVIKDYKKYIEDKYNQLVDNNINCLLEVIIYYGNHSETHRYDNHIKINIFYVDSKYNNENVNWYISNEIKKLLTNSVKHYITKEYLIYGTVSLLYNNFEVIENYDDKIILHKEYKNVKDIYSDFNVGQIRYAIIEKIIDNDNNSINYYAVDWYMKRMYKLKYKYSYLYNAKKFDII